MLRDSACSTFRKILVASVFGVGVFLIPNGVQSATSNSATLQWADNQEPDLAGYQTYHGTVQGSYGPSQNVGMTTTYQYTNLESDKPHFFSVTAYDTSGNVSSLSLEVFKPLLSLSVNGEGTVTSSPAGLSCPSDACAGTFSPGSSVTLTATPNNGSTFSGWGGACQGTSSCVVTLSTPSTSVSATFATSSPPSSSLNVTLAGTGSGTVTSSPTGVSCTSGTCTGTFPQGSSVTLTAAPIGGSTFSGWGGSCTGTSSCVVALSTSSASVSANFASSPPPPQSLGVSLTGDGKGSVTSNPPGLTCSEGTCTAVFPQGTTVILTPTTESGSQFEGWSGVCSGTSSCSVTLSSPQVVTAAFVIENSNPPPSPEFPMSVNFQPSSSEIPPNFTKDDGSVFNSSRGYGWDVLVNSKERNAQVEQTIDTFVQTGNRTPVTWNYTLPNGTYYISMVMGDPRKKSGPHSLNLEGMQLATQIKTGKGEYFSVVEYPVNIQDNTLSITLGGGRKGTTLLNFVIINSAPSLSQTMQALTQSFGTDLLATVDNPGTVAKVNPERLVRQENHRQRVLAKIQRFLAKIERKLVKYADKPKKMARLNKHKERLLAKLEKIQESRQSMN